MKKFLTLVFTLGIVLGVSGSSLDTIPTWNFYYKGRPVLKSNSVDQANPVAMLSINPARPGKLVATFTHDVASTFDGDLIIRHGEKLIRRMEYRGNPSGLGAAPSVRVGSDFVIFLQEILGPREELPIQLDFFYADQHTSERLIASILFKPRK